MSNFIFLQYNRTKAYLNSADSETGRITLSFGNSRTLECNKITECELCTMVYTPYLREDLADTLRGRFEDIEASEIDDFCEKFKEAHKVEDVGGKFKHFQLIDLHKSRLQIDEAFSKLPVKFQKYERGLVKVAQKIITPTTFGKNNEDGGTIMGAFISYFAWLCQVRKNGADVQNSQNIVVEEDAKKEATVLARRFCFMHGIDIETAKIDKYVQKELSLNKMEVKSLESRCTLSLYSIKRSVVISAEDEVKMLRMIKTKHLSPGYLSVANSIECHVEENNKSWTSISAAIEAYLRTFYEKECNIPKRRNNIDVGRELACSFCDVHGLDIEDLDYEEVEPYFGDWMIGFGNNCIAFTGNLMIFPIIFLFLAWLCDLMR